MTDPKPSVITAITHALETLKAIEEFLNGGSPVYPGALLLEDERTIAEHVKIAVQHLEGITAEAI